MNTVHVRHLKTVSSGLLQWLTRYLNSKSCYLSNDVERETIIIHSRFSANAYSSRPKCRRWTIAVFSYILDTTRANIQTLVSLNRGQNPRKVTSFDFGHKLAMSLLTPHIYTRELTGVPHGILLKMHLATSDDRFLRHVMSVCEPSQAVQDKVPYRGQPAKQGKRCGECVRDIYAGGTSAKDKRLRINSLSTSSTRCARCGQVKCNKKHLVKLCASCLTALGQ